jgi:acetyl esterase/lipase
MTPTHLRSHLFAAFCLVLPTIVSAQTNATAPTTASTPSNIQQINDYVFTKVDGHDLHADIAFPKDSPKPLPAIIYVHGGGWAGGGYPQGCVMTAAQHGYFCASIEYRLSGVAKWPAQIQDCETAVRWLRANAPKFNVDPNRIGVWGDSAGGHLVTCLGTMADVKEFQGDGFPGVSSKVQAVVDYYGPTHLVDHATLNDNVDGLLVRLFGGTRADMPDVYKNASPYFHVKPTDPPMLIVQGDCDGTVPLVQSTLFADALTEAGVPNQLIIVKNGDHGFGPGPGKTKVDPNGGEIQDAVFAFFDKQLKP